MKGYKGMDANMGDLINRTEAISNLRKWLNFPDYNKGERNIIACAIAMLEEMPSAQKHGKWIEDGYEGYPCVCSYCGIQQDIKAKFLFSFCPNCGKRMKSEEAPEK